MSSTSNVASDRVRLGRLSEPVMTPLGFKGLDIRSRPLTFQLRVVALWPLVDPIKKTERQSSATCQSNVCVVGSTEVRWKFI